jgi:pSer/pThr/pTyr-binding forkhead associated (FHA) protein
MPILTLKFKDSAIGDYQLQKGLSLTIGRRKNNDVVIENLAVSGHHAKIDSVGDEFVLIDLQSKNGSFVNEQIISTQWLKDGDVINIGKHALAFNYTDDEQAPADGSNKIDQTMVMDTSQYRSMMKKSTPKVLKPLIKPEAPRPLFKNDDKVSVCGLNILAGGGGKFKLSKKITKIGKHPDSDIVIKGMWVAQTAVTISKRPDGFYLSYVGGMSKPKINDKLVKHSILLNDLDVIDIGPTKLQFYDQSHSKTRIIKIDPKTGLPDPDTI